MLDLLVHSTVIIYLILSKKIGKNILSKISKLFIFLFTCFITHYSFLIFHYPLYFLESLWHYSFFSSVLHLLFSNIHYTICVIISIKPVGWADKQLRWIWYIIPQTVIYKPLICYTLKICISICEHTYLLNITRYIATLRRVFLYLTLTV